METGGINSFVPLLVAAHTGLPALDVDGMGRAFPELQMFAPFIYGLKAYPGAVADNKEESIVCTHADGAKILEEFFRKETVRMGYVAVLSITHTTPAHCMPYHLLHALSLPYTSTTYNTLAHIHSTACSLPHLTYPQELFLHLSSSHPSYTHTHTHTHTTTTTTFTCPAC